MMPHERNIKLLKSRVEKRSGDNFTVARRRMLSEQLLPGGIRSKIVLDAMGAVKRHLFVSPGMEDQAYLDRPLPIGFGQTISQPLIVAKMTEALDLKGHERILEIGTGSGYQAAVLSQLVRQVFTIERLADLSIRARKVFYRLHMNNITLKIGDGTIGWPDEAPFDGIIVTAGAPCVPDALCSQLADGGKLIIPVGGHETQSLEMIIRNGSTLTKRSITACRFVKLVGEQGWNLGDQ